MIHGNNFFDHAIKKNDLVTYKNIRKVAASQGGDYTTGYLLDSNIFKNYYKMRAIDRSQTAMYFIIEEAEETILNFSQGTVKYWEYHCMN